MRIAFLWHFNQAEDIYENWHDGLRGAIDAIGVENDVDIYCGDYCEAAEAGYDFLLFWTDSNDQIIQKFLDYPAKKGLCLTTMPNDITNLKNYDVVYCESDPVYNAVRQNGIRAIKAFGTDTDFFSPDESVEKDIPFFYPATFSPWKRQSAIAHLGDRLLCVGTVQPDGKEELESCENNNVKLEKGYFPAEKIRDYYRRTREIIIPAIHGSERTVLEAMATDILPKVNSGNQKTYSYIKEYLSSDYKSPRQFVIDRYSHRKYAQDLLRGMK